MKRYNRDKRAIYKQRTRNTQTHDTCDGRDRAKRIHIKVRYANYNRIEYIPVIYRRTRNNKEQTYVNIVNTINDIFPQINAPHTRHIYRANAEYKKFIPPHTDYTAPEHMMDEYTRSYTRIERVKCIIYNNDEMIHAGVFKRTITTDGEHIQITLHRANRSIEVRPYIPHADTIHGVTIREIYEHDVEIYKI